MSKYSTIAYSYRHSFEQSIQKRILDYSSNRQTIGSSTQSPLMSNNKSIIYIKLPKNNASTKSTFKPSLYQSSLKRLKQLQSSHSKESKIPNLQRRRKFEEFQSQVLHQYNLNRDSSKKILPNVHNNPKISPYKANFTLFAQESPIQQEQINERSLQIHTKKTIFFDQQGLLGYRNLKQKYLQTRQVSLNQKRKIEMQSQSRNSIFADEYQSELYRYPSDRYKMSKEVEEHMNRYNKKDLFQTKLKGFKTNIHQVEKYKSKYPYKGQEIGSQGQFSNFVKRKKLKSVALNQINLNRSKNCQDSQQQFNERKSKIMDCTPWETDLSHLD